jgi:hypothetical protein
MLGDELVEVHAINLGPPRGLADVAASRLEHGLQILLLERINQLLLGGLERHRQVHGDGTALGLFSAERQTLCANRIFVRYMKGPLDGIAQLANIARPGVVVVAEPLGDLGQRRSPVAIREPLIKVLDELRDVLASLAQRRDVDI